jgi:hypothetical protein
LCDTRSSENEENMILISIRKSRCDTFSKLLMFEVRDGSLIRFWDDVWCIEEPLKFAYLELYRIACVKDVAVADFIQFQGEAVHWQVNFIRLVQDWEIESISSFLELLYSINIKRYEKVRGVGSLPSLKVSR